MPVAHKTEYLICKWISSLLRIIVQIQRNINKISEQSTSDHIKIYSPKSIVSFDNLLLRQKGESIIIAGKTASNHTNISSILKCSFCLIFIDSVVIRIHIIISKRKNNSSISTPPPPVCCCIYYSIPQAMAQYFL